MNYLYFVIGMAVGALALAVIFKLFPKIKNDGVLWIDETDPTDIHLKFEFDTDFETVLTKKEEITFKIRRKK